MSILRRGVGQKTFAPTLASGGLRGRGRFTQVASEVGGASPRWPRICRQERGGTGQRGRPPRVFGKDRALRSHS